VRTLRQILVTCLLFAGVASAAELVPVREGDRLGANVTGLSLPDALRRDLRSGLTNRMLIRVELLAGNDVVDSRTVELAVKYDLWDENFRLTFTPAQGPPRVLTTDNEVLALLKDVSLPRLFDLSRLVPGREHVLRCDLLLNPIEEERLAMVRKWVAQNSIPSIGSGVTATHGTGTASASYGSDLFTRIFEQYAAGGGAVGVWTESLRSPPFRRETLPE
jgi:hypothetical protein